MQDRFVHTWLSILCSVCVSACAYPINVVRVAEPVKLSSSAPVNSCEQREWYEIVPVRAFAGTQQIVSMAPTITAAESVPRAIYRQGQLGPENLVELLPRIDEPEVMQKHTVRFEPIEAKNARSTTVAVVGTILGAAGFGLLVATAADASSNKNGRPNMGLAAAGGSIVGVGVITAVIAAALAPSAEEQLFLASRKLLVFPDEDEMPSVERGLRKLNEHTRSVCQSSSASR